MLQFKVLVNIVEHGHSIVMNNEDVIDISQYVGVVDIAANENLGIDTHVRVGSERVVPLVSHAVIQVNLERRYITLHAIESTNYDGFLIRISILFVLKDGSDIFGNGCCHVGIHNIT